ncbi:hypothetical protein U0L90_01885 [Flavobacteriaceae sp. LMIT009]
MKKLIFLFALVAFIGCKKDVNKEGETYKTEEVQDNSERTEKQSDGLTLLKGQFIYYADAAVLQTHVDVYGVIINDKMHELNEMVQKHKKVDTDMIPVEVRGRITPRPENEKGWDFRVEIVEILKVSAPDPNAGEMITIGKE